MLINKIYQQISQICNSEPARPALYEDSTTYTYLEFKNKIDNSMQLLHSLNPSPGDRVGVFINNSVEAYAVIYACALLGLTYIPLAIDDPAKRILTIINIAEIKYIVCEQKKFNELNLILEQINNKQKPLILIADSVCAEKKLSILGFDDIPLYILFTSGSTGTPKGVLIMPNAVENFIDWAKIYLNIQSTDVFLAHSRLTFDLSVFNLFLPMLMGASVRIVKCKAEQIYPGSLLKKNITIALMVPRVTGLLLESDQLFYDSFPQLRHLLFCGEKLLAAQANAWITTHQNLTLHNIYGPTETTVTCTYQTLPARQIVNDPIAIGSVIPNVQLNFLNEASEIVLGPTQGELIISGIGVSPTDYCGQKTERFFDHKKLGRCFRTGDIIQRDHNGQHYWITRLDDQIKIRGFRVELGEIEAVLSDHPDIIDLICTFDPNSQTLTAIMSLSPNVAIEMIVKALKEKSEEKLPTYMRPAEYVVIEKIPRNSNGKADRVKARQLVNKKII